MSAGTDYISISFKTATENANYYINGSKICITKMVLLQRLWEQ